MKSKTPPAYWLLIEPYWEKISIYDGPEQFLREFQKAPLTVRNLFASHWLQSEVLNGGFGQFFDNSTGVLAPEAADGFLAIGMPETSKFIRHVMSGFGEIYPRDREQRVEFLEDFYDNAESAGKEYAANPLSSYLDEDFFELVESENGGFWVSANRYAERSE